MKPFNIVYLNSHDTGRCIQPCGFPVATPRLQQFAEQGVLFRNNFTIAPTCSPSRAGLVTGCYPHENGMWGLAHRGFRMHDYQQHLIHTLHTRGYTSVLAGIQHVLKNTAEAPAWQGIGYTREIPGDNGNVEQRVVSFLAGAPPQPFYLEAGFFDTHREFPPADQVVDDPRYCAPPPPLPDTPETRLDIARFKASARNLDRKLGLIFDALDRAGLRDKTLVICTTDHGIAFPRMKCHLHDTGTGTYLMLRGPGGFHGGQVVDAMTTHLDIFPTICEMLEIPPPAWLRGQSLLPLVRGKATRLHDEIFGEINFHAAYEPVRSVRTDRWKYIRRFDGRIRAVLPNCDDGESKTLWRQAGWPGGAEQPLAAEQLYDLQFDPVETDNRAADPAMARALKDMRARLDRWMIATNDPLLNGPLKPPPGVILNDPDGQSPKDPTLPVTT